MKILCGVKNVLYTMDMDLYIKVFKSSYGKCFESDIDNLEDLKDVLYNRIHKNFLRLFIKNDIEASNEELDIILNKIGQNSTIDDVLLYPGIYKFMAALCANHNTVETIDFIVKSDLDTGIIKERFNMFGNKIYLIEDEINAINLNNYDLIIYDDIDFIINKKDEIKSNAYVIIIDYGYNFNYNNDGISTSKFIPEEKGFKFRLDFMDAYSTDR